MNFLKIAIMSTIINFCDVTQQISRSILMRRKRCQGRFRLAAERRLFPGFCWSEYGNSLFYLSPRSKHISVSVFLRYIWSWTAAAANKHNIKSLFFLPHALTLAHSPTCHLGGQGRVCKALATCLLKTIIVQLCSWPRLNLSYQRSSQNYNIKWAEYNLEHTPVAINFK